MPELPDLLYIRDYLRKEIVGKTIASATVEQPVVIRLCIPGPLESVIAGKRIDAVNFRGPFLRFQLAERIEMIVNLMLAGSLQHQRAGDKAAGYGCCSFHLDDGTRLNLCDEKRMAKLYVTRAGEYSLIPKYSSRGVDVLSSAFTPDVFRTLAAKHARKQVRVFVNDQSILSAIGNAYADEILFDARIHPKTFVGKLGTEDLERLFASIVSVLHWGASEVARARKGIHVKVRDHMKVRNRHGEKCYRCGATVRREGVRGHDVYFCPSCQQATRKLFIDWKTTRGPS